MDSFLGRSLAGQTDGEKGLQPNGGVCPMVSTHWRTVADRQKLPRAVSDQSLLSSRLVCPLTGVGHGGRLLVEAAAHFRLIMMLF